MKRPVRVHDVQKLTGCLAALSRFISRLGEKALPLYRLMKKSDKFEWNDEGEAVFEELKALLSTQPVLAAPISFGSPLELIRLLRQLVKRQCLFTEARNESTQGGQTTSKLLDILHTHKEFHPKYSTNFLWVSVDPSSGNEETE